MYMHAVKASPCWCPISDSLPLAAHARNFLELIFLHLLSSDKSSFRYHPQGIHSALLSLFVDNDYSCLSMQLIWFVNL